MFKTILIVTTLVLMFLDMLVIVFGRYFIQGLKSNDLEKRAKAEDKYDKVRIISYLAFVGLVVLLVIIMKVF